LSRPVSVNKIDDSGITFLYKVVGKGTEILSQLEPKDDIKITGPLGNGFDAEKFSGKIAVVAGGIGIAPMPYLIETLKNCTVDLYAGFRNDCSLAQKTLKYADNVYIATERGDLGQKGYVTDILEPKKYDTVVCCGPNIMMNKVVKMCKEDNVPVYLSLENKMACGVGACLVCTCKTKSGRKRACKDGPVFLGEELVIDD
ncbi:MAG: dihydroorotate dehydrogenase electron transfer subunit, partial [Clostridium sp.]|nr:dihydroorotate dehydrogenase electron transfer subunit [Clostridium sp.]